jgi:hypothetical protein
MARFAGLTPVVNHLKQAVVAESGRRGVGRIAVGAADHSHRQPIQLASNQTSVAMSIDVLVGDLLLGRGMVAAMTGVDQLIAKVLVIFVAAGHHDGVGTFTAVAGGSAHRGRCTSASLRAAREAKVVPTGSPGTSPKNFATRFLPGRSSSSRALPA